MFCAYPSKKNNEQLRYLLKTNRAGIRGYGEKALIDVIHEHMSIVEMRHIILVFLPYFNANNFTYTVARYFYFLPIFITLIISTK